MSKEFSLDVIVALAKSGVCISRIRNIRRVGKYLGLWPNGVELKNNVKQAWWKKFVQESKYNVGLDAAILMNRKTWVASGHVDGFSDPLIDCKNCKSRFRADKLAEDYIKAQDGMSVTVDGWSNEKLQGFIAEQKIPCPDCGEHNFTSIRKFNLMFKTFQGVTEDSQAELFLRPETAQGIFVNFRNVARTTRKKIPFGIAPDRQILPQRDNSRQFHVQNKRV